MTRRLALVLLTMTGLACTHPMKETHEQLAAQLREPASKLCHIDLKEGGGCYRECLELAAAREGQWLAAASQALVGLPASADPEAEKRLVAVRSTAADVQKKLGKACPASLTVGDEVTDDVTTCTVARRAAPKAPWQLFKVLDAVHEHVAATSEVPLPDHRGPCLEDE